MELIELVSRSVRAPLVPREKQHEWPAVCYHLSLNRAVGVGMDGKGLHISNISRIPMQIRFKRIDAHTWVVAHAAHVVHADTLYAVQQCSLWSLVSQSAMRPAVGPGFWRSSLARHVLAALTCDTLFKLCTVLYIV